MSAQLRTGRPRDTLLALPLICLLLGGLAVAQEQNQAAKAAAQAVGSVGQAAARAVARDASQPVNVPGFEGTDLAEADHTATGMDAAARRALADPNDAGGAVGRAVVNGTLSRPDVSLSGSDPEIQRGDSVQNTPNAPAWRADSLASGTVRECGADLADARAAGVTHYLGEYCAKRILGICRRRDRAWCVFTSELGRILHEQARPQLGMTWDDCRGFSIAEIQRIDFDRVDLSEFSDTLLDTSKAPGISLPDAGSTGAAMRNRIGEFYRENE